MKYFDTNKSLIALKDEIQENYIKFGNQYIYDLLVNYKICFNKEISTITFINTINKGFLVYHYSSVYFLFCANLTFFCANFMQIYSGV